MNRKSRHSSLVDAYKAAMAGAEKRSKRQAAASVGDLFDEAYALQPLVLAKAEAIGGDAGVAYGSTKTVGVRSRRRGGPMVATTEGSATLCGCPSRLKLSTN